MLLAHARGDQQHGTHDTRLPPPRLGQLYDMVYVVSRGDWQGAQDQALQSDLTKCIMLIRMKAVARIGCIRPSMVQNAQHQYGRGNGDGQYQ